MADTDGAAVRDPKWVLFDCWGKPYRCDVCGGLMLEADTEKYGYIECCPQCAFERYAEYLTNVKENVR